MGAAALVATLLALLGAHDPDEGPGPPPWRVGGRLGFTADFASFADSAGHTLELYVRVPPRTIEGLGLDAFGNTHLRLTVHLKNAYGARQHQAVQEFSLVPADTASGFGKVVVMRFPTRPGRERVLVRLEDLNVAKRGLANLARAFGGSKEPAHISASVEGEIQVPGAQAGRDLSDLEFVWRRDPTTGPSAFQRGDQAVLPNPERLYGLYESELRAFFRAGAGDARPWHWIARVLDDGGQVVAEQDSVGAAARILEAGPALDLSREPAGGYDLEVKAWQDGDSGAVLRRAHFSVAWKRDSWDRNPADVEDDVHFLLSADDEEAFVKLHPGEQERYLEKFWRERDPTPETAENEARDAFLDRVKYANKIYTRAGLGPGMFSDMGRVYIRYGPPGEVFRQVLPSGDESLRQVVRELALMEDRPIDGVSPRGIGADIRPWEVWVYEGEIPLPPDADPKVAAQHPRLRRMLFLFVDEHGLGDYRLRYSTE